MSFVIPSLLDLVDRARKAFRAHLPGSDAWLWPNNINPTAKVIAGMTHEVFGYMDHVARQKFAVTADWEGLLDHGEEFGLPPHPADAARGTLLVTAETAAAVSAGAVFRRGDGLLFSALDGGALIDGGTVEITVVAQTGGKASATEGGTSFSAVSGVEGTVTAEAATGGLIGGRDAEDLESYRARILFRKRNPPNGGKPSDYVIWASQIPGVTRVFVEKAWMGGSTVRVFVLMDDLYPDGIPPQPAIDVVADHLEALVPAGALVTVQAPTPMPVDIEIGDVDPPTTEVQSAIVAELQETFRRLARVAGTGTPHPAMPYLATPQSFSRSWAAQAVSNAVGEGRHNLRQPVADRPVPRGAIPVLGNVKFVFGS